MEGKQPGRLGWGWGWGGGPGQEPRGDLTLRPHSIQGKAISKGKERKTFGASEREQGAQNTGKETQGAHLPSKEGRESSPALHELTHWRARGAHFTNRLRGTESA